MHLQRRSAEKTLPLWLACSWLMATSGFIGCQTVGMSRGTVSNSQVPSRMMNAQTSQPQQRTQLSRAESAAATPLGRANQAKRQSQSIQDADGYVAQAAYQISADEGDVVVQDVYDPSLRRVPMPQIYGMQPVASYPGMPTQPHQAGCACCSSGTSYQPIYKQDACGSRETDCMVPAATPYADPQEYIYDGGDQDPAVRIREDYSLAGLGPEDTVVQFTTEDGREFAETGCRAAIYAPRFAAVRRITRPSTSDGVLAARAALRDQPIVHIDAPLPAVAVVDKSKIVRESKVDVVEAFRDRNRGVPLLANQAPVHWSSAFKPYEDLSIMRTGVLVTDDLVALRKGVQNAITWSSDDELMVIIDNKSAAVIESKELAHELLTYELGGARLRMCKVASQQSANVGDVVDFTIRFDNIAEQKLSNLVIHDSLPPRLEYVPDSEQSSLEAEFETEPNEVGSEVLRWKIKETLKPGEGGIIRFQAKVR